MPTTRKKIHKTFCVHSYVGIHEIQVYRIYNAGMFTDFFFGILLSTKHVSQIIKNVLYYKKFHKKDVATWPRIGA